MRLAPPVRIEVPRDRPWRGAVAALAAMAAAVLTVWLGQRLDAAGTMTAALLAVAAPACALAGWRWPGTDHGTLVWDGLTWSWAPFGKAARPGDVHAVIDLDGWMLLRFECLEHLGKRRHGAWLALSSGTGTGVWHALRTAVYSRRPEPDTAPARTGAPSRSP